MGKPRLDKKLARQLRTERARIIEELSDLLAQRTAAAGAAALSEADVRGLLNRLLDQILVASAEDEARDEARQALREVIERIEVDLKEKSPVLTVRYAINTGDSVASPRGFEPLLQP
jgi:predicted component of type VI protein secretion system